MLYFIGMGISGYKSLSLEGVKVLKKADHIYLERFTSPIEESIIIKIKEIITGKFIIGNRWLIEDGKNILENAKDKIVVLLTYGDPYIATTHIELRCRAILEKINVKTIHSSSSITSIVGECGLHYYKIGRIATMMKELKTVTSTYYIIYRNMIEKNHTILLLEFDYDNKFFLKPKDALHNLLLIENEQKRSVISSSLCVIIASRIGLKNQKIVIGDISNIMDYDFGKPPHTIIIPGTLHFTEYDALKIIAECINKPHNNINKKISKQFLDKYTPMINTEISEITNFCNNKKSKHILKNAQAYLNDANQFFENGYDEVAILNIGYADGLIDALKILIDGNKKII